MGPVDTDKLFTYIKFNDATELEDALKDSRVDPNVVNDDGWSLLHIASQFGNLECIKVLLKNSRTNINIKGPLRITPLFSAIENKQLECAKVLLAHSNINVNIRNESQQTPLLYAIENDRFDFVKLLISHPNINLSTFDGNGKTASDLATESKSTHRKEILELLGQYDIEELHKEDVPTQTEETQAGNTQRYGGSRYVIRTEPETAAEKRIRMQLLRGLI